MNILNNLTVSPDADLLSCLQKIDDGRLKVVYVVDGDHKLLGVLSDGDARRYILKEHNLEIRAKDIMNREPITVSEEAERSTCVLLMKSLDLMALPVVDKCYRLVRVEPLHFGHIEKIPVLIMAGGFGKRLHPLTENTPKPMLKVGGKPILEHVIDRLVDQGFCHFIISTHYLAEHIREYFTDGRRLGITIEYVHEEIPLGTAGALGFIEDLSFSSILMLNGDVIVDMDFGDMMYKHFLSESSITIATRNEQYQVPYGVIIENDSKVVDIREKPVLNHKISAGIYGISKSIVERVVKDKKLDMPDLIMDVVRDGGLVSSYELMGYWKDIGRHEELEAFKKQLENEKCK